MGNEASSTSTSSSLQKHSLIRSAVLVSKGGGGGSPAKSKQKQQKQQQQQNKKHQNQNPAAAAAPKKKLPLRKSSSSSVIQELYHKYSAANAAKTASHSHNSHSHKANTDSGPESVGSARGSIASMNSGGGGGGVQTPRSAGEGGRVGYIKKAAAGKPRKHVAAKLEMSLEASPLAATSTAEPGGGGRCPSPAANGGGADFRGGYRRPSSGSSSQQRPLTPLPMAKRRTPLITMSRSQCSSSIELATAADGAGTPNSGGNSSSGSVDHDGEEEGLCSGHTINNNPYPDQNQNLLMAEPPSEGTPPKRMEKNGGGGGGGVGKKNSGSSSSSATDWVMRHRKNSAVTNMVAAVTGAGAATEEATDHRASAGCGLQQQLQTAKTALHPPQADRRRSTSLCAQQLKADCQAISALSYLHALSNGAVTTKKVGVMPQLARLRIQQCFKSAKPSIGQGILRRACALRSDFKQFLSHMNEEKLDELANDLYILVTECVANVDQSARVASMSFGFGEIHALLCNWGFRPEFFSLLADATIAECIRLDGGMHKRCETLLAWSQLIQFMFSNVRDGYYAEVRQQRRSSLPQHRVALLKQQSVSSRAGGLGGQLLGTQSAQSSSNDITSSYSCSSGGGVSLP